MIRLALATIISIGLGACGGNSDSDPFPPDQLIPRISCSSTNCL